MSSAWNGIDPVGLPSLTVRERLRLVWRGAVVAILLFVMGGVCGLVRLLDVGFARVFKRPEGSWVCSVVRLWARMTLWMLGIRIVQRGTPMASPGAFLANHSSWLDILVLQSTAAPYLVSKSEVRGWPVIGMIGRWIGTLYIDRKSTAVRTQQLQLLQRFGSGDQMALFPEGTSTDGQRVIAFKSSLFAVFFSEGVEADLMAQPVAIFYHAQEGVPANFYGWWGDMDFARHLWEVLARSTDGVVEVQFLEPVRTADYPSRKAMALAAEGAVREGFNWMRRRP